MDLRNKTTSEFRTVLDSPFGVPNSQVSLYIVIGNGILHVHGLLHKLPYRNEQEIEEWLIAVM